MLEVSREEKKGLTCCKETDNKNWHDNSSDDKGDGKDDACDDQSFVPTAPWLFTLSNPRVSVRRNVKNGRIGILTKLLWMMSVAKLDPFLWHLFLRVWQLIQVGSKKQSLVREDRALCNILQDPVGLKKNGCVCRRRVNPLQFYFQQTLHTTEVWFVRKSISLRTLKCALLWWLEEKKTLKL